MYTLSRSDLGQFGTESVPDLIPQGVVMDQRIAPRGLAGRTLGQYRVLELIGAGGVGEVYRAHDDRLRREVALKILFDDGSADAEIRKRIRREALALSKINHPNIATVFDVDTREGVDFLVMELVTGSTLHEKVQVGPLPAGQTARFGLQMAEGLAAAHARGVAHRDLKPTNIRVTSEGLLKILDFGLAKSPGVTEASTETATAPNVIRGTLPYMAPEQLRSSPADFRSDIWAAGLVLFEMATGRRAFSEVEPIPLMSAILHSPAPYPREVAANVSPALENIILKCLEKEPDDRYQSAKELAIDLRRLETSLSAARPRAREQGLPRWTVAAATGAIALAILLVALNAGGLRDRIFPNAQSVPVRALAVLPLDDLSGERSGAYFAEGMTDELITTLARSSGVRVIARTSVMRYAGTQLSPKRIGHELHVDALVEGGVQVANDRIHVNTRLVRTSDGRSLWADSFDRPARDALALQGDIARAIAAQIRARWTDQDRGRVSRRITADPQAQEAYLRGKYHWNRRTFEDLQLAARYFRDSADRDTNFALAWAGLANSYGLLPEYGPIRKDDIMPRARAAALRALALDSTLAEGYAALGNVEKSWTRDWDAAEHDFRRALEWNPGDATAHHWYAVLLAWMGRIRESRMEIESARELDPLSLIIQLTLARICILDHEYPRAEREYRQAIELEPRRAGPWLGLSSALFHEDRVSEAAGAWEHGVGLLRDTIALSSPPRTAVTRRGFLDRRLQTIRAMEKAGLASAADLAAAQAAAGDREAAFRSLEEGAADQSLVLGDLVNLPDYDPLRSDPRYRSLLERLGGR